MYVRALFRSLDHKLCVVSVCLLLVVFLSGFTYDVIATEPIPIPGPQNFWVTHVDMMKWVVWALFAYMVWSVKRTLEKVEASTEHLDERLRDVEGKLTEIMAEHATIISRGGH